MRKGNLARVVTDRGGSFGAKVVLLWFLPGAAYDMWATRPVHEEGWDGRAWFFEVGELQVVDR